MDARNFQFMFYGLAAAWLILAIYGLTLLARERKLQDEIRRLKSLIDEREHKS